MKIQGTFTERDLRNAGWTNLRPRRTFAVVGVLIVAAFCWALWLAFFGNGFDEPGWVRWAMLSVAVYSVLFFIFGIPYRVRRTYRQRKDLQRPCTYLPSEKGLGFETEGAQGTKAWSDYLKWKEGRSVFLLYMSDQMFHVIPKRFFSSVDELNAFRELLAERVAPREV
jgi:hypothetical protein